MMIVAEFSSYNKAFTEVNWPWANDSCTNFALFLAQFFVAELVLTDSLSRKDAHKSHFV